VPEKEFPERARPRRAEISAGEHPVGSPPYIGLSLSLSLFRAGKVYFCVACNLR